MSIIIKEKDLSISWEQIRELIFIAHNDNRKKGLDIRNAHLSSEELQQSLGKDGVCFIASEGDKLVGTCSIAFKKENFWFHNGEYAYLTLDAVHPDYRGRGIFQQLEKQRMQMILARNIPVAVMYIAQKNKKRRNIAKKTGFQEVEIKYNPYNSHNFIIYCKWMHERKTPYFSIKIRYILSRFVIALKSFKRILTK